ncbi:hypothetical protein HF086_013065 [Spodoptera exigua]|uniref:Uncharacterized protein n=1 Tax=Spodoptera exigua TaxID=7107 RepID=A0A922M0C9_SPOEX|nr:hypothetical protein HF086_013065 [Spodoptera exigua]
MKDMLSSIMGRFSSIVDDESEIDAACPSSDDDDLQDEYLRRNKTLESADWAAPALTPEDDDGDFGFFPQTKE